MKVCVLGGSGMLGHVICDVLSRQLLGVSATFRGHNAPEGSTVRAIVGFNAYDLLSAERTLSETDADAFINCIGVIKHDPSLAEHPEEAVAVNAAFPHLVARIARQRGTRLIHFSTDCVFSGAHGNYSEDDFPDAVDLYGRSKVLGEPAGPNSLVLRTSMIGPELRSHRSLLDWLLSQRGGTVRGFRKAFFSGLTTFAIAQIVLTLLQECPRLSGTYHLASERISKYDLLTLLNDQLELGIDITADDSFAIDRSLNGSRLTDATGISVPSWSEMVADLATQMRPHEVTA